jgi:hypothetical protein
MSVRVVSRDNDVLQRLPFVAQRINEFLDYSTRWRRTKASHSRVFGLRKAGSRGLVHLIQRLGRQRMLYQRPRDFLIAVRSAVEHGHISVVQWFFTEFPLLEIRTNLLSLAAGENKLPILQWLHHNTTQPCAKWTMDHAAQLGHWGVVRFLHTNRTEGCTTEVMDSACKQENMEMMEFLYQHRAEGCSKYAIFHALQQRRLNVLQWLWLRYPNLFQLDELMSIADKRGYTEILFWLVTLPM